MMKFLIVEDEPLLAAELAASLARLRPDDVIVSATNAAQAREHILAQVNDPFDAAFLDIAMPGESGLDLARWLVTLPAPPRLIFTTAFDHHAVDAFAVAALDYLVKPIREDALKRALNRLDEWHKTPYQSASSGIDPADALRNLQQALAAFTPQNQTNAPSHLRWISASGTRDASGNEAVRVIPVSDIAYFAAADKMTRVVSAHREDWIRTSLKDLLAQLDPAQFRQVSRSVIVRLEAVEQMDRDLMGRRTLRLRGRSERIALSQKEAELFRPM